MVKKGPSIKDVAERAGVSTATVSNVFSGAKPVTPELAEKVRNVALELGYQVNRAASVLRSGRSKVVPVLVPDLSDPFFTSLVTEIEVRAEQDGYEIIVGNSRDNVDSEARRLDALLSWQPSGLIIVPCTDALPERLRDPDLPPVVLADRISDRTLADTVAIDNRAAGRLAAEELCRLGHRHIVVAASNLELHVIRERCGGVEEEVARWGGTTDRIEVGPVPDIGAERLNARLAETGMPTALIGVTDMTTLAVLTCLAERGLTAGEDVSVVGFDDYPWMSARRTPLTAVRQPIKSIADSIWERLTLRMDGLEDPPTRIVHSCTLQPRASTRPPKVDATSGEERQRNSGSGGGGPKAKRDAVPERRQAHPLNDTNPRTSNAATAANGDALPNDGPGEERFNQRRTT